MGADARGCIRGELPQGAGGRGLAGRGRRENRLGLRELAQGAGGRALEGRGCQGDRRWWLRGGQRVTVEELAELAAFAKQQVVPGAVRRGERG